MVDRINREFIPVALKAAHVDNPPPTVEGRLMAEIRRSRPAPQGICTLNSAGKVLSWVLAFKDESQLPAFLDHVLMRYKEFPDASQPVAAERFERFPRHKQPDLHDSETELLIPSSHPQDDPCLGRPQVPEGTLIGTVIGRPLDRRGNFVADTKRQEHYMEARLEITPDLQEAVVQLASASGNRRFRIPIPICERIFGRAYLGMLDVNPLRTGPGGQRYGGGHWEIYARAISGADGAMTCLEIEGTSNMEAQLDEPTQRREQRNWEHRVTLRWYGFVELKGNRVQRIAVAGAGDEHLLWDTQVFGMGLAESAHLGAGHKIDFDGGVRYGILAEM